MGSDNTYKDGSGLSDNDLLPVPEIMSEMKGPQRIIQGVAYRLAHACSWDEAGKHVGMTGCNLRVAAKKHGYNDIMYDGAIMAGFRELTLETQAKLAEQVYNNEVDPKMLPIVAGIVADKYTKLKPVLEPEKPQETEIGDIVEMLHRSGGGSVTLEVRTAEQVEAPTTIDVTPESDE